MNGGGDPWAVAELSAALGEFEVELR